MQFGRDHIQVYCGILHDKKANYEKLLPFLLQN